MTFLDDIYSFDVNDSKEKSFSYIFFSYGERKIKKVVYIREIEGFEGVYNLAFGNVEKKENGEEFFSDSSSLNNSDFDKVLRTVFACVFTYLVNENPNAKVLFFGNTQHKHIKYRGMIARYLEELTEYFKVQGGELEGFIPLLEETIITERKGKKRKRVIKIKDEDAIQKILSETQIERIEDYVQDFDIKKIRNYQFILIELK